MQTINEWLKLLPDDEKPPGHTRSLPSLYPKAPLDPSSISEELGDSSSLPVKPSTVHYYVEDGLPWIRVSFGLDESVTPQMALAAGKVISGKVDPVPVFFHALRSSDVLFILKLRMASSDEDPQLPVERYGKPISVISSTWKLSA